MAPDAHSAGEEPRVASRTLKKVGEGLSTSSLLPSRPYSGAARGHVAKDAAAPPADPSPYYTSIYSESYNNSRLRDMMYSKRDVPRPSERYGRKLATTDAQLSHLAGDTPSTEEQQGDAPPPKRGRGKRTVSGNLAYLDKALTTLGTSLDSAEEIVAHKVGVSLPPTEEPAVYAAPHYASTRLTGAVGTPGPYGPKDGTVVAPWTRPTALPWKNPARIRTTKEHLVAAEEGLSPEVPSLVATGDLADAAAPLSRTLPGARRVLGDLVPGSETDAGDEAGASDSALVPTARRVRHGAHAAPPAGHPPRGDRPVDSRVSLPMGEMNRKPLGPSPPGPVPFEHLRSAHRPPLSTTQARQQAALYAPSPAAPSSLREWVEDAARSVQAGPVGDPAAPATGSRPASQPGPASRGGLQATLSLLQREEQANARMFGGGDSRPGTSASRVGATLSRTQSKPPSLPGGPGTPSIHSRPATPAAPPQDRPATPAPQDARPGTAASATAGAGPHARPPSRARPLNEAPSARAFRGMKPSMQAAAEKPELLVLSRPSTAPPPNAHMPVGHLRHDIMAHTWRPSNHWLHPAYTNGFLAPLPATPEAAGQEALLTGMTGRVLATPGAARPVTVGSLLRGASAQGRDGEVAQGAFEVSAEGVRGESGAEAGEGEGGDATGAGAGAKGAYEGWQEERRKDQSLVADITQGVSTQRFGTMGKAYGEKFDGYDREHMWGGGDPRTGMAPPRDAYREEAVVHEYNDAVRILKDKLETYGRLSFLHPFEARGTMSGGLGFAELRGALEAINLGNVSDATVLAIMARLGPGPGDRVDCRALADALAWDKLDFAPLPRRCTRRRAGPDGAAPFGGSTMPGHPWGTLPDASANVRGMSRAVAQRFVTLDAIFHQMDPNGTGRLPRPAFVRAMRELDRVLRVNLSDTEIANICDEADPEGEGEVDYRKFLVDYASQRGMGDAMNIPEFMKPRSYRSTVMRAPWLIGSEA